MYLIPFLHAPTDRDMALSRAEVTPLPGQAQGVHISLNPEYKDWFVERVKGWFAGRGEVILVDHGFSEKLGLGTLTLEWDECAINYLFLHFLRDEPLVEDYTVYLRDKEV